MEFSRLSRTMRTHEYKCCSVLFCADCCSRVQAAGPGALSAACLLSRVGQGKWIRWMAGMRAGGLHECRAQQFPALHSANPSMDQTSQAQRHVVPSLVESFDGRVLELPHWTPLSAYYICSTLQLNIKLSSNATKGRAHIKGVFSILIIFIREDCVKNTMEIFCITCNFLRTSQRD